MLKTYTPQGWWPLTTCRKKVLQGICFDDHGYHHGDYLFPKTEKQKYEIAIGAILTQNTAWTNVRKALDNLEKAAMLSPGVFSVIPEKNIAEKIKPSGYFNQKAKKLIAFDSAWQNGSWGKVKNIPTRNKLLEIWGVGEETADSILLYVFHQPVFVVDAYTRRIFSRIGILSGKEKYAEIQSIFMKNLPAEEQLFNEFHALIVEHAKVSCRKKPVCAECFLNKKCNYFHSESR